MPIKDKQKRQDYFKDRNKRNIIVNLNPQEHALLKAMMIKEGWENQSGFIRFKLLGEDYTSKYKVVVNNGGTEESAAIIGTELKFLNCSLDYYQRRYERDMKQLYREEGVDINAWIKATKEPHRQVVDQLTSVYQTSITIAKRLGFTYRCVNISNEDNFSDIQAMDNAAREMFEEVPKPKTRYLFQNILTMQTIILSGTLLTDAKKTKDSRGREYISFVLTCITKDAKEDDDYFHTKCICYLMGFEGLKKGDKVFLIGRFVPRIEYDKNNIAKPVLYVTVIAMTKA